MENTVGITTKLFTKENHVQKFDADSETLEKILHEAKSVAGKNFNQAYVESVCVYDHTGKVYLYLRKDAQGKCIKREEVKL